MSTFQEMIQFFNNTHVRNAIHENVCVIFYGTDLTFEVDKGFGILEPKIILLLDHKSNIKNGN